MKQIILTWVFAIFTITSVFSQQKQLDRNMKTALLIIDIQNDYFEKGAMTLVGSYEASKNARLIINKFRADSLPIIYIQHIATSPSAAFFLPDTEGADIHESLKPLDHEKVIIKHYPNSFRGTELLDYLKSQNVVDLVICGMMTHMCINAATRAAKDFGYKCIVIGDACATKDLEINGQIVKAKDVQNSFLAALNSFYSSVITAEQYLELK